MQTGYIITLKLNYYMSFSVGLFDVMCNRKINIDKSVLVYTSITSNIPAEKSIIVRV